MRRPSPVPSPLISVWSGLGSLSRGAAYVPLRPTKTDLNLQHKNDELSRKEVTHSHISSTILVEIPYLVRRRAATSEGTDARRRQHEFSRSFSRRDTTRHRTETGDQDRSRKAVVSEMQCTWIQGMAGITSTRLAPAAQGATRRDTAAPRQRVRAETGLSDAPRELKAPRPAPATRLVSAARSPSGRGQHFTCLYSVM